MTNFDDRDDSSDRYFDEGDDWTPQRMDVFGFLGILFAIVGWIVILLGVPLLAVFGVGIFVMLAGSGICLIGSVPSLLSSNPPRKIAALVLNGVGAIPAAFIVLAEVLNYLFPV